MKKKNQSRFRIPTGIPTGRLRNKLVNYDTRWRTIEGRIRGKELIALVPHFTMAMLHKTVPRMYRELVAEGNKRWLPESPGGGYISQPALRQARKVVRDYERMTKVEKEKLTRAKREALKELFAQLGHFSRARSLHKHRASAAARR